MLKSPVSNLRGLIQEAKVLEKEGAEAIRVAVEDKPAAKLVKTLNKHISVPLVADIHFQYQLALLAIENGFDGIRLNPLNIYRKDQVKQVVKAAKAAKIPIRIGVNSGGFKRRFSSSLSLAKEMFKACQVYIKILEAQGFLDIMVSLKGSDVASTILANKLFSQKYKYPLHLGVTATGSFLAGTVKSSLGIGNLLYQGIGDIFRVSLTGPSYLEIRVAKQILSSLNLRKFGPEIISCPTCSRCQVNLSKIVDKFKQELAKSKVNKDLNIAIMGGVVNGPGEAYQADIGAAFGKKGAVIFKKDKVLKRSQENKIIDDLIREVKTIWA